MPKALWIAHVNVLDAERLGAYAAAATPVIAAHGGVFLARGGAYEQLEGQDHTRNVVAQFPSLQAAHRPHLGPRKRHHATQSPVLRRRHRPPTSQRPIHSHGQSIGLLASRLNLP